MQVREITIGNVEQWNDGFAAAHDIDDYYARSGLLIRAIERTRLTCIRRMIAAEPTDRILEVGCGGGHVLRMFPDAKLTAVDVSGSMLAKARRNLQGYDVCFHKGEVQNLDLPSGGFDKIICSEVLEHVVDPDSIVQSIAGLLRPGGRAVVTFPNDHLVNRLKSIIRRTGLCAIPPFRRISWGGDAYHLHIWPVPEMHELLSRHLTVVKMRFAPSRLLPIRCCFECTTKG